ncbi:MAG TPA: type II toxin-antitoxin system RelE/ParE family toxin [Luteibacter sp.]|uniref:type II toxin-antitoxin system RelE/ParE family toxin n=1 Tax=Luteibacter sp. TaxID=1886636 RepID=UPI002D017128|nr:type II toxin-antitoxin system RelE/ParE family toxin [Luteibacter sp.]HVI55251.1 type II toxin-antitoxin system RelE/ParE family toxin [Luteibacter sp.]
MSTGMSTWDTSRSSEVRTSACGRTFYVTHVGHQIYVLHAFAKKTQKTPLSDIKIGRSRYKSIAP